MKKHFAISRTRHYIDYFIVEIEVEDEDTEAIGRDVEERIREFTQQEAFQSYATKSKADDCEVDMDEMSEEEVLEVERQFHYQREQISLGDLNVEE